LHADEETDLELVQKSAEGDEDAFERLVHRYEDTVYNTVYRYVGDAEEAEDLAQEVFLKIWRRAGTFAGHSKFSTWLYRVAVNQCLNHRRKKGITGPLGQIEAEDPKAVSLEEEMVRKREVEAVRQAIDSLPGRQRLALILAKYEDRSYSEIAEIMGVSVSSVESLIHRARTTLRNNLSHLRQK